MRHKFGVLWFVCAWDELMQMSHHKPATSGVRLFNVKGEA